MAWNTRLTQYIVLVNYLECWDISTTKSVVCRGDRNDFKPVVANNFHCVSKIRNFLSTELLPFNYLQIIIFSAIRVHIKSEHFRICCFIRAELYWNVRRGTTVEEVLCQWISTMDAKFNWHKRIYYIVTIICRYMKYPINLYQMHILPISVYTHQVSLNATYSCLFFNFSPHLLINTKIMQQYANGYLITIRFHTWKTFIPV